MSVFLSEKNLGNRRLDLNVGIFVPRLNEIKYRYIVDLVPSCFGFACPDILARLIF